MKKRVLGLLLIVAMLASCFAACGGDDKNETSSKAPEQSVSGEASTENSGETSNGGGSSEVTFDSLTDNREKLVYLSDSIEGYLNYEDKIFGVLGVEGDLDIPETVEDAVVKLALQAQLTEFSVDGSDMLEEQFGGPIGVDFNTLTDGTRLNLDAEANFAGMNIDFDVKAGENGVLVTSPFVFTKPVYVSDNYLNGLMVGYSDTEEITNALTEFSSELSSVAGSAAFAAFLRSKAVELIPEDAVETTTTTVNGDYINGEAETECVVLTLNGDQLSVLFGGLRQSIGDDPVFKTVSAGLFSSLSKLFALGVFEGAGNGMSITTDTELYDAVFDFADDMSEELKGNTDLTVVIKRYFLNGIDSRWDIEITEKDESAYISYWDIYVDNGNDYGFVVKLNGEEAISVKGGSKGDKSELSVELSSFEGGLEMGDDGMYSEGAMTVLSFGIKRDGKECDVDINLGDMVKVDYNQEDSSFDAILFVEDRSFEVDGTIVEKENGVVVNARLEIENNDIEITYDRESSVSETKLTNEIELTAKVEIDDVITVAKVESNIVLDTNSGEIIIEPVPGDDDFVIDDEEDISNIFSNFSALFLGIIGGDGSYMPA